LHPGAGPRHLAFSHSDGGKRAFILCELTCDLVALNVDPSSHELREVARANPLPADSLSSQKSGAHIAVTPDDNFVIISLRVVNQLAVYRTHSFCEADDTSSATLQLVGIFDCLVKEPRGFAIHPSGRFLVVGGQNDDRVAVFVINRETGELTHNHQIASVPTPVCLAFITL